MYIREILATINLAHHFDSAFTPEQAYRFLRVAMARDHFRQKLAELKQAGLVEETDGALFTRNLQAQYRRKQEWSRALFQRHRGYLRLIAKLPWIKFAALTGANAFESCADQDDIDLFLVTRKNRLWISYVLLVLYSKLIRKRHILCINYLVDEKNLCATRQDYYTAVQIIQMVPLLNHEFAQKILAGNRWIFEVLPNAEAEVISDESYHLDNGHHAVPGSDKQQRSQETHFFLDRLNRFIYRRYARHLAQKYPGQFGEGIVLTEGLAKLNRVDHRDIYEEIYQKIYRELETTDAL